MAKWGSRQVLPPQTILKLELWTPGSWSGHVEKGVTTVKKFSPHAHTQTGDRQANTVTTYQNRSQPARTSTETKLMTGSWHCLLHYTLGQVSLPSPLTGFVCGGYVVVEVGRKEIPFWAQRGTKELFGDYAGALGCITVQPQKLIPTAKVNGGLSDPDWLKGRQTANLSQWKPSTLEKKGPNSHQQI